MADAQLEILTQVAAGSPMGELLRRYWHPIAGVSELDCSPTKPVRLMGEDLVLYKDRSGTYGLIDRHCPHRRADLAYGFVEEHGLRCNYHGWLMDEAGRCLHQPYEDLAHPDVRLKDRIRTKAYPVVAKAGLLWAYLGPQPAPLLPNWEPFTWKNGFVQIVISEVPCNWLQGQENSIDPVHFEWMHANWSKRLRGENGPYGPRHLKLDFREFEYGYTYNRIREDTDEEHPLWTVGRVCLWPNAIFTGDHFEYRVPMDDENMLSIGWFFTRVPREREPYVQEQIPTWQGPIKDEHGNWITSHVMNQDFLAWAGQGRIADRSKENLGASDRGVVMLRRRFLQDLQAIERGEDPKGLIRDPAVNASVDLPVIGRDALVEGLSLDDINQGKAPNLARFIFQYGQPESVRRAQEEALGVRVDRASYVAGRSARSQ